MSFIFPSGKLAKLTWNVRLVSKFQTFGQSEDRMIHARS